LTLINLNDSESSHYASKRISEEHFEELFCEFYPKLLAYAISILNDKQAAEDIV
jgi:DNA-directed RNA polymerase specialized sigma24 family protein